MSTTKKVTEIVRTTARRWDGLVAPTGSALDEAKRVFAHEGRFAWSTSTIAALPAPTVPEIAFLGCSNVGKSSLLNVLLGRKRHKLVRTSTKPGHTKALNGFQVGREVCLVDSPGYGYRSRDEWGTLIMAYLRHRKTLKRTCLLIESSHGFKTHDEELIQHLASNGIPFQVIFTKMDKVAANDFEDLLEYSETYLRKVGKAAVWGEVLGVSNNQERLGIAALQASLCKATGITQKITSKEARKSTPKVKNESKQD